MTGVQTCALPIYRPYEGLYQKLPVAEYFMKNACFVGVWPGLDLGHMQYVANMINSFLIDGSDWL